MPFIIGGFQYHVDIIAYSATTQGNGNTMCKAFTNLLYMRCTHMMAILIFILHFIIFQPCILLYSYFDHFVGKAFMQAIVFIYLNQLYLHVFFHNKQASWLNKNVIIICIS